ncbi:MAG: hypothetical protein ABI414_14790, partial [Devosia sp.]
LEEEKVEVFNLKKGLQDMITALRNMFSLLRRLRLTVQERDVVRVMEGATEQAAPLTSADELRPS